MKAVVSQQRLIDETAAENRVLLEHYLRARRCTKGPLVLVNEQVMHTNTEAAALVQSADHTLLWEWASRAAATKDLGESSLKLTSGLPVAARTTPIEDRGLLAGVLLRLDPVEPAPARGARVAEPDTRVAGPDTRVAGPDTRVAGPDTQVAGPARRRPDYGWASLTSSERSVAEIIAEGATNREAAARLFLSRHTIDFHLRQIFRKLGIRSRVALARLVVQNAGAGPGAEPLS
jgi:DNA-binding CsgD family transcriptional regulator